MNTKTIILSAFPAFIGAGVAWLGVRLIKSEARLLVRELELKENLTAKSKKTPRKFLFGQLAK